MKKKKNKMMMMMMIKKKKRKMNMAKRKKKKKKRFSLNMIVLATIEREDPMVFYVESSSVYFFNL
jgi:hypothetical protein